MTWKPQDDSFSFEQYSSLAQEDVLMTKRSISSIVPKIYNINGYLAAFTLRGKVLLQKCWTYKDPSDGKALALNDTLPQSIATEFKEWIQDIPEVSQHRVSRYLFGREEGGELRTPPPMDECELHGFGDVGL